jgi:phospholipid/cholesterol/gamma-HCH transport system substrate-binding protein
MESNLNYTLVGAFVIILGVALIGLVAWLTAATDQKVYEEYRVYVSESVSGLSVNAPVKYKGVGVGKVADIALDSDDPNRVKLRLLIEQGTPIRVDTTARLVARGITGLVNVELSGGSLQSPPLRPEPGKPAPEIASEPSLVAQVEDAFNNMYVRIDNLLSPNNVQAISQTLEHLRTITATVANRSDGIDRTLVNLAQMSERLADSAKRLDAALAGTKKLDTVLDRAAGTFKNTERITAALDAELRPLLAETKATLVGAQATLKSIAAVGRTADAGLADIRQEMLQLSRKTGPDLNRLLNELERLTGTVDRFVEKLDRNPRALLFGDSPGRPGPGE